MPPIEIRPFRRDDREQLTGLVNAHVAAVIPGITVSVNAVMSQLEREPSEAVTDPWVVERKTLVAVEGTRRRRRPPAPLRRPARRSGPTTRNAGLDPLARVRHKRDDAATRSSPSASR